MGGQCCSTGKIDVFNSVLDPILIIDKEHNILDANSAFLKLLTVTKKGIVGKKCYALMHGTDRPWHDCPVCKTILTKGEHYSELYHSLLGKHLLVSATPILDENRDVAKVLHHIRDITEIRNAEEDARKSEERYRLVADNTYNWEFWLAPDGICRYISPSCERITGYSPGEFIKDQHLIERIVHPQDREAFRTHISQTCVQNSGVSSIDFRIVRKDGGERWISHYCCPVYSKDGTWLGRRGSNRDITGKKRAEQSLWQSEERYKELFSNMRSGVAVYSAREDGNDFIIADMNPAGERLSHVRREDIVGKSVAEAFPGVKKMGLFRVFQEVWRTGKPGHHPVSMYKDKCLLQWFENYVYKLPSGEIIAVYDEVTERKKTEDALRQSEERHRQLVENINDVLFTITPDGVIRYISPQVKGIFGFEPADVVGKHFSGFAHPDDREKLTGFFKDIMSGRYYPRDYRINHSSGRPIWVRSSSRLIVKDGKVTGIHGRITDITKEKELEMEKEALHVKAKERLVMIQKQNIQLISLQKRLKQYANKLEIKVKKLEESKLNLTDKERLVFYALVACPDMNDRELAEQTKLKRSTVTSIKNRLKEEKLYEEINVPDLAALGCGLMTAIYGKFDMEYGEIRRMREKVMSSDVVFAHTTDTGVFAITATKDLVSFHKDIGPSITFATKAKAFKDYPSIVHFPLELSIIQEFFSFAPALRESFSMTEHFTQRPAPGNAERQPLTKNAKEILYALVKHPEASTVELAKMLRLTRGTVSRIRNDLFKQGIVKKLIVPDIKRLNYAFSMVCHFKQAPGITADAVKKFIQSFKAPGSTTHLALLGAMESMGGRLFRDGREHAEFMSRLIREMKAEGLVTEDPSESILHIQETRQFMFSFAPITKKMLGIGRDV